MKTFFFLESTCACVLGPWPWPRAFLSLASRGSVLGKAVLGLGLGFFLCLWPWSWLRALCPRLHLSPAVTFLAFSSQVALLFYSKPFSYIGSVIKVINYKNATNTIAKTQQTRKQQTLFKGLIWQKSTRLALKIIILLGAAPALPTELSLPKFGTCNVITFVRSILCLFLSFHFQANTGIVFKF